MIQLENKVAYTLKEASPILNLAVSTLRDYIRYGKLRAQKVGHYIYVTDETIQEFLETRKNRSLNNASNINKKRTRNHKEKSS